ncbi:hypothetical protein, partial [Thiolapillus sp.]
HENLFSWRVPWHEKWAIGLSWSRPGAQKRRNQGIGERCGLGCPKIYHEAEDTLVRKLVAAPYLTPI